MIGYKECKNVPSQAAQFKRWADRECTKWPAHLQVKAYHAWTGLEKNSQEEFRVFTEAYESFVGSKQL